MIEAPFHPGEHAAQALAGVARPNAAIRPWMPDQHRTFFGLLSMLPIATVAADGSPVATVLSGAPGFVSSPDPNTLSIAARPDDQDPASDALVPGAAIGILGIDLATRRRNRANGILRFLDADGMIVSVSQSFGNCPQYIQTRFSRPAEESPGPIERFAGIDAAAHTMISGADTFFVASTSGPEAGAQGGVDISHRGGLPGFIRIEGTTLTIPDFHGNRYFNTFGNLLLNPSVALLFVDWSDGTLLHLCGEADVLWNDDGGFPGAERLWRVGIKDGWRRPGALPLRWSFGEYAAQLQRTGVWTARRPLVTRGYEPLALGPLSDR